MILGNTRKTGTSDDKAQANARAQAEKRRIDNDLLLLEEGKKKNDRKRVELQAEIREAQREIERTKILMTTKDKELKVATRDGVVFEEQRRQLMKKKNAIL